MVCQELQATIDPLNKKFVSSVSVLFQLFIKSAAAYKIKCTRLHPTTASELAVYLILTLHSLILAHASSRPLSIIKGGSKAPLTKKHGPPS
jgi:hypothetical protein